MSIAGILNSPAAFIGRLATSEMTRSILLLVSHVSSFFNLALVKNNFRLRKDFFVSICNESECWQPASTSSEMCSNFCDSSFLKKSQAIVDFMNRLLEGISCFKIGTEREACP